MGTGVLSLGVKRTGREADHSPPSSAEVNNAWRYTFTPQYVFIAWCLVKHRDNFTFTFTFMFISWTYGIQFCEYHNILSKSKVKIHVKLHVTNEIPTRLTDWLHATGTRLADKSKSKLYKGTSVHMLIYNTSLRFHYNKTIGGWWGRTGLRDEHWGGDNLAEKRVRDKVQTEDSSTQNRSERL
jgi:hypothetical protein